MRKAPPEHAAPRDGMVRVPGGTFLMGSQDFYPEEQPVHEVTVDGFWMDRHTVTNADFRRFVEATGYVTVAERPIDPAAYPGAQPDKLVPGALVFRMAKGPVDLHDFYNWWTWVPGASWRHPWGPGSTTRWRDRHPVVQVAYEDVEAYAAWAGKSLPTEAEWELAARGGLDGARFVWGDDFTPNGKVMANTWHGEFPWQNLRGRPDSAPVESFPANGYGLYEMAGNVWEWTSDWYAPRHEADPHKACCTPVNPRGASIDGSYDECQAEVHIPRKVLKGGSFLCAPNYCLRYRPAARQAQMIDTAMVHLGFRCVIRRGE
jgi:formylglycine-generating enzyme required for sulfatase activity